MRSEKVKFLIDMINDMDVKNKLRLAISISSSNYANILYDKNAMYEYFDNCLKEIDEHYRTTHINFNKYHLVTFVMAKIIEMSVNEQNQVVLYLVNSIDYEISKKKQAI